MVRPVVHSTKHYVQFPIDQISTGTVQSIVIADGVESTIANSATEVEEGAIVKAVFLELWLENQGNLGEFIATLTKVPEFGTGPTFAQMAALFTYSNKKNILYCTQGLTPNDGVAQPVNLIRNWFKIPKGKQRFGLGDRLILSISNTSAQDLNRCGFATYKEYS